MLNDKAETIECAVRSVTLAFAACEGLRMSSAKPPGRYITHLTIDGFAKPLNGGSNKLDPSTPAFRFGGKTAPTRRFRGYAQFVVPDFWAFVLETPIRDEAVKPLRDAGAMRPGARR